MFSHLEALLFTPKPGQEEAQAAEVQLGCRLRLPLNRFRCYLEQRKARLSTAVSVVFFGVGKGASSNTCSRCIAAQVAGSGARTLPALCVESGDLGVQLYMSRFFASQLSPLLSTRREALVPCNDVIYIYIYIYIYVCVCMNV